MLRLNLLIRKISENLWSDQEEAKVSDMVEKVAANIQQTFIPECSVNQDIDELESTTIIFTTKVESGEESLVQFDNEKEKVELIDPDDVNNRVNVITDDNGEVLYSHMQLLKPVVRCTFEILDDVSSSPAPRHVYGHIAFPLGDEMLVYGGMDKSGNVFNKDVWVYSMKTSSWKQHKTKFHIPSCVVDSRSWLNGNQMFLFGGWNGEGNLSNDVHSLDLDTWEWTQHSTTGNKPSGRMGHALWTIANNIIVHGGEGAGGRWLNDTFHLNTHSMKWTELSTTGTPPSPRQGCAYAQCAGKGFLFGGYEFKNPTSANNDLHMFDLTSHVWTQLQPTTGSLPPERQESQMIVRGTDLIIYGGDANWVFFDCWVWSIEEKSWREVEDYFDQRWSHTACYTSDDDNVLVFGGIDQFHETLGSLGRVSFGHLDQKKGKRMTSCDDEECTSTFINDELEDHDP